AAGWRPSVPPVEVLGVGRPQTEPPAREPDDPPRGGLRRDLSVELGVVGTQLVALTLGLVEAHVEPEHGDIQRHDACEQSRDKADPDDAAGDSPARLDLPLGARRGPRPSSGTRRRRKGTGGGGEAPAGTQHFERSRQRLLELAQLVVDGDPERLEDALRRMTVAEPSGCGDRRADDVHEVARALDRLLAAPSPDGARDLLRVALLPVLAEDRDQLTLRGLVDELGR